jgi:hypothetical protein
LFNRWLIRLKTFISQSTTKLYNYFLILSTFSTLCMYCKFNVTENFFLYSALFNRNKHSLYLLDYWYSTTFFFSFERVVQYYFTPVKYNLRFFGYKYLNMELLHILTNYFINDYKYLNLTLDSQHKINTTNELSQLVRFLLMIGAVNLKSSI